MGFKLEQTPKHRNTDMSEFTVKRMTHNEANGGHCANANNSRYRGTSIVWVVFDPEGYEAFQSRTKKRATELADWANTLPADSLLRQGIGDLEMAFIEAHRPA